MASIPENHIIDLLPAYVLDALTGDEMNLVAEHVTTCPACQAELLHLQQVTDDLPLALAQASPPPSLKARLMEKIHSSQHGTALTYQPSFWQRLQAFLRRSLPAWSLALIAVLAIGNVLLWNRYSRLNLQATSPMRVIDLASTSASSQAVGTLIINQKGDYGTVVVDKLAALGQKQQYQVWLIQDGTRTSGGVFSVNTDGYASLEIMAPQALIRYDSVGITIEPYGGSPAPTGVKVMGGDIPH